MDDKKDYKAMLKLLDATATLASTLNKLGALGIETEDDKLKKVAVGIASLLRSMTGPQVSGKGRLLTIAKNLFAGTPAQKQLSETINIAFRYCQQCETSAEKQWQILARNAGWAPPSI